MSQTPKADPDVESASRGTSDRDGTPKKRRWAFIGKKFWTTRQMAGKESREKEVQITLRELIIYVMFLICLLILSLGMASPTMYYYTKVMTDLFLHTEFTVDGKAVTFQSSTQMADFWQYAETAMVDSFYWDFWYKRSDNETETEPDEKKIAYENLLLGVPRIRQVRVRNQSCLVHDEFKRSFSYCYDFYSHKAEDRDPFARNMTNGTAWEYTSEQDINGSSYVGLITTYGGGGYYKDLASNYGETVKIINDLKKNLWIDRGTRAVFVDFTVYNANVNLFCIIKLVLEIPPTGGVIPSSSFRTLKLLRYVRAWDYFVLGVELIFIAFIVFYTLEELRELIFFKCQYFKSFWNLLDMTILVISYICIGFSVYRYEKVRNKVKTLSEDQKHYEDFTSLGLWQTYYNSAVAILVFFGWIKIFKYISFNKTLSQLSNTLSRCAADVAGFAVMFFIVFCAFAQLGYLLFGTQVQAFSSFKDSVFSLLRTILGDFDYEAIENANRVLGPIFFLSYIFFVFFVLLNMFLAIINDTYSEVKSEISVKRSELEVVDFLARGYHNIMNKIGCRKKALGKGDGEPLSQDDIRTLLKKSNFTDLEIEMFFAKYDIDKTKTISKEETLRLLKDLESREKSGDDSKAAPSISGGGSGISPQEIQAFENRLAQIEAHIGDISDKVDAIVNKLEERLKPGGPIDPNL